MDWKNKNLECIKKRRPEFYERLLLCIEAEKYSEDGIESIEAKDGNQILCVEKNGKKVRLNSLYRPIQEAQKWVGQYEFQNLNISVLMFGIGNGIFLREMLKKLDEDALVILYEPDFSIFFYQLQYQDFSDITSDRRVVFFVKEVNKDFLYDFIAQKSHWTLLSSRIMCCHPGYGQLFGEELQEFRQAVEDIHVAELVDRNTLESYSHAIVLNTLKNLHFVEQSNYLEDLVGMLPDTIPVIIVSAGPSLDKNIDQLKKAAGHALIIATETAVKYLLQHNVLFDIIITVDARKSVEHLKDSRCADVPFFVSFSSRNEILESHTGRKIWIEGESYVRDLYVQCERKFPVYHLGGCVATSAYKVCKVLGMKRIILVGQDLAYGNDNKTHAGGVKCVVRGEEDGIEYVPGMDGNPVLARRDWIIYRKWFEKEFSFEDAPEVIDATEGGALIEGTKVMPLAEAIDLYCKEPFELKALLDKKQPTFNGEEYQKFKTGCASLHDQFMELGNKAREGLKIANELLKMVHRKEVNPKKEKKKVMALRKINSFMGEHPANEFLEMFASNKTTRELQTINKLSDDKDKNKETSLETAKLVYQELLNAIDVLDPVLEETLKKM